MSRLTEAQDKVLFEDDVPDPDAVDDGDQEAGINQTIQLAAPGNLQLSAEIDRLQEKIQELIKQEHLLDTLIQQAELIGNQAELRILDRSLSSVRREQRTVIFQKAQFEQQEEENRLVPGRTKASIPTSAVSPHDKQVTRYTVDIKQTGDDGSVQLGWIVLRRYNEFFELDKALKEWAAGQNDQTLLEGIRSADLPGKKLVPSMSASFVDARRTGLERYLQVSTECPLGPNYVDQAAGVA